MKKRFIWLIMLLTSVVIYSGCSPKSRYEHRLRLELAKGVRYDSLFMGFYFGMPEKEFYLHCWKMNQKGLARQGETNNTVLCHLKDELKYPATMDFYPRFTEGKIYEIPVRFKYVGWAPWNKNLSSDNLQSEVLKWYESIYGKGFIEVKHPKRGSAFVRIDGNRRITIFKQNDMLVWAVFTDMLVKKDWKSFDAGEVALPSDTTK
ncbi:MAG: hypothetical protein Q8868_02325 [Bacteroidota bacterium]|nr:hypothetical protein [Bacteroidota bacterium]